MSITPIPMQLKIPEVYTGVRYDGENIDELIRWVEFESDGEYEITQQGGQPYLVDAMPYTLNVTVLLEVGSYVVKYPSGEFFIYSEEDLLTRYALANSLSQVVQNITAQSQTLI